MKDGPTALVDICSPDIPHSVVHQLLVTMSKHNTLVFAITIVVALSTLIPTHPEVGCFLVPQDVLADSLVKGTDMTSFEWTSGTWRELVDSGYNQVKGGKNDDWSYHFVRTAVRGSDTTVLEFVHIRHTDSGIYLRERQVPKGHEQFFRLVDDSGPMRFVFANQSDALPMTITLQYSQVGASSAMSITRSYSSGANPIDSQNVYTIHWGR